MGKRENKLYVDTANIGNVLYVYRKMLLGWTEQAIDNMLETRTAARDRNKLISCASKSLHEKTTS